MPLLSGLYDSLPSLSHTGDGENRMMGTSVPSGTLWGRFELGHQRGKSFESWNVEFQLLA